MHPDSLSYQIIEAACFWVALYWIARAVVAVGHWLVDAIVFAAEHSADKLVLCCL